MAPLAKVPAEATGNMRNDMYLASEALKRLPKEQSLKFGGRT